MVTHPNPFSLILFSVISSVVRMWARDLKTLEEGRKGRKGEKREKYKISALQVTQKVPTVLREWRSNALSYSHTFTFLESCTLAKVLQL